MYNVNLFMVNGENLITRDLKEDEIKSLKKILLSGVNGLVDLSDYHPTKDKDWFINLSNVIHITMTKKTPLEFKDWRQ